MCKVQFILQSCYVNNFICYNIQNKRFKTILIIYLKIYFIKYCVNCYSKKKKKRKIKQI